MWGDRGSLHNGGRVGGEWKCGRPESKPRLVKLLTLISVDADVSVIQIVLVYTWWWLAPAGYTT